MVTKFEENINETKQQVVQIGKDLYEANKLLLNALADCDDEKFTQARAYIKNIGSKTDAIDNSIIKILALYTPEARDLREVIAFLKITNELARACSNTRSFIRGFTAVCTDVATDTIKEYAVPMQTSTLRAIELTVTMIECNDADEIQELYNEILIEENKTDDLYEMVERNLTLQAQSANDFEKFHKMLKALRKSGKVAARAISIANLLVYAKVGGNFHN